MQGPPSKNKNAKKIHGIGGSGSGGSGGGTGGGGPKKNIGTMGQLKAGCDDGT